MNHSKYEPIDLRGNGVLVFALVLLIVAVAIHLLIYALHRYFAESRATGPLSEISREEQKSGEARPGRLATDPPLQGTPAYQVWGPEEVAAQRSQEELRLRSYGWVDRSRHIVHVPIEQAMKRLVEQGLTRREEVQ